MKFQFEKPAYEDLENCLAILLWYLLQPYLHVGGKGPSDLVDSFTSQNTSVHPPHLFHLYHLGRQRCDIADYSGSKGLSLTPMLSLILHGDVGIKRKEQNRSNQVPENMQLNLRSAPAQLHPALG